TFSVMINMAIYFRAFISILARFLTRIMLPLLDALLIFIGIFIITGYWEKHFIFPDGGHYPDAFISIAVPIYLVIWLLCIYLSGGYDKPVRLRKIITGMTVGTIIILLLYSLLNEHYRFSRALIFLGAIWGTFVILDVRLVLHFLNFSAYRLNAEKNKRFVIIGEKEEAERVSSLLQKTGMNPAFIGLVSYQHHRNNSNGFIGHLGQIKEVITIHKIDEVIFCAKDLPAQVIIDKMSELKDEQVDYKIAPPESLSIIGSNSINTSGDLYVIDINAIIKKSNRRNKRILDVAAAASILTLYPVLFFIVKKPIGLIQNIIAVLFAMKSWVGYTRLSESELQRLPGLKTGVLNPQDAFKQKTFPQETSMRLNLLYARDYKVTNDVNIIIKGFRELGRQ
ncbi:MAG: glycosyl transferase family 2, partial [Bacteroidota bacterium]